MRFLYNSLASQASTLPLRSCVTCAPKPYYFRLRLCVRVRLTELICFAHVLGPSFKMCFVPLSLSSGEIRKVCNSHISYIDTFLTRSELDSRHCIRALHLFRVTHCRPYGRFVIMCCSIRRH